MLTAATKPGCAPPAEGRLIHNRYAPSPPSNRTGCCRWGCFGARRVFNLL